VVLAVASDDPFDSTGYFKADAAEPGDMFVGLRGRITCLERRRAERTRRRRRPGLRRRVRERQVVAAARDRWPGSGRPG
jgi:hypothetical protein